MLSFGAGAFLFGLLALAVPILAHLIQREMAVRLRFPSIRFITRAHKPRDERRRLRDLFLLVLRLLALAALVLVFAQPRWEPKPATAASETDGETILLVDASASMAGWNGFEEARARALKEIEERPDRRIGMIIFAHDILAELPPGSEPQALKAALETGRPHPARGRPGEALNRALKALSENERGELIIISDFGESTWLTGLPTIPTDIEVAFHRVGSEERSQGNVGIVDLDVFPFADGGSRTVVRVRNYGTTAVRLPVRIEADDQEWSTVVDLQPGQTRPVPFESDSRHRTKAVAILPEDAYGGDNRYYFWMGRPPAVRVVAFLPGLEEPERAEDFFFVRLALEAAAEGDWVQFAPIASNQSFLEAGALSEAGAVFLPGSMAYLDREQALAVRQFCENGGVVLITPGRSALRMFREMAAAGLGNHQFEGMTAQAAHLGEVSHPGWIHPDSNLGRLFTGAAARDLLGINVFRYARLRPDPAAEVLIRSESGDALLLKQGIGQGLVYLAAFGFGPEDSDIRVRPSFVPLLREIFSEAATEDITGLELETGQALPAILARRGGQATWTDQPGAFEIDGLQAAVNIAPSEGSPAQVAPNLRADEREEAPAHPHPSRGLPENAPSTASIPLWPWMVLLAAIAFALETAFAYLGVVRERQPTDHTHG